MTVGAGVLLVALAACAQQPSNGVGFGGQPPAPPPGPAQPAPEQERSPVASAAVDAALLPKGFPVRVWTQDNDTVVVATGQEGGCGRVHGELSEQADDHVTVVLVEQTPDPPGMCTMDLRYPPVAVRLDKPLDGRKVVLEQKRVKVPR